MYSAQNMFAWLLLLGLALLLLAMGTQGSLGKVVAVAFVPSELDIGPTTPPLSLGTPPAANCDPVIWAFLGICIPPIGAIV